MSQKKKKKRRNPQTKPGSNPMALQETEKTKRFNPMARRILIGDLIFLAVIQMLVSGEMIGDAIANIATLVSLILLIAAVWIQFGPKNNGPKAPRL